MKKIYLFLIILTVLLSYEKRRPTIYEDHNVEACGVKDPLVNLAWLAEKCDKVKKRDNKKGEFFSCNIRLMQDTVTKENAFLIHYEANHISIDGYDCSGKGVYAFWSGGILPPPELREAFYKNKIYLNTIFDYRC